MCVVHIASRHKQQKKWQLMREKRYIFSRIPGGKTTTHSSGSNSGCCGELHVQQSTVQLPKRSQFPRMYTVVANVLSRTSTREHQLLAMPTALPVCVVSFSAAGVPAGGKRANALDINASICRWRCLVNFAAPRSSSMFRCFPCRMYAAACFFVCCRVLSAAEATSDCRRSASS